MEASRIITIAGVSFCVSDSDYRYYWNARNCGEESDSFKVACRRILGLGPHSHQLDNFYVKNIMWGGSDESIQLILKSGLVEYQEKWIKDQNPNAGSALELINKEMEINKWSKRRRHKL